MTATTITYGGIASSTIPELYVENIGRQITPGVRDVYVDVPGRDGSWLFPEAAGDRTVSARIAIVGDDIDTRRAAVRKAARWLWQPGPRRSLIISDEPDRFYRAALAAPIDSAEAFALGRFDVEWRTASYSEDVNITEEIFASGSGTVTVTASDDLADYMAPEVEVYFAGGSPGGFTLTLGTYELVYGAAIPAAGTVTVSAISSTVIDTASTDTYLDGTFAVADLAMTEVSGDMPLLLPGANSLAVTGTPAVTVRYRRRFI